MYILSFKWSARDSWEWASAMVETKPKQYARTHDALTLKLHRCNNHFPCKQQEAIDVLPRIQYILYICRPPALNWEGIRLKEHNGTELTTVYDAQNI
jgi:hypothetical protein